MADLSAMGLDPNVEEANGTFEVLPAGDYNIVIAKDDIRDNSKGTGRLLVLELKIIEGVHTGKTLTDWLNIKNPDKTAQDIGQGTLKKICNLCGVAYPPPNTTGLYGKPMGIRVGVKEFKSNKTDAKLYSNNVKSYKKKIDNPQQAPVTQQAPPLGDNDVPW